LARVGSGGLWGVRGARHPCSAGGGSVAAAVRGDRARRRGGSAGRPRAPARRGAQAAPGRGG
ncbi:unnamed protein product, partial [Prorocentrum cordatum]